VTASELLYSSAVSRLHRPFLSDFFITVRVLEERAQLVDADFHLLALAFNRTRVMHPFYLSLSSRSLACPWRAGVSAHDLAGDEIHQEAQAADLKNGGPRYLLYPVTRSENPGE
jgi:hypothetical protein